MEKDVYKIMGEIWKLAKKYIPISKTMSDKEWQNFMNENTSIYKSTEDKPSYYREMTSKMLLGVMDLIEGMYKEGREND